jgi:hypothetical protein
MRLRIQTLRWGDILGFWMGPIEWQRSFEKGPLPIWVREMRWKEMERSEA